MALVGYESSDEDEEVGSPPEVEQPQIDPSKGSPSSPKHSINESSQNPAQIAGDSATRLAAEPSDGPQPSPAAHKQTSPAVGPAPPIEATAIGPSLPPAEADLEYPEEMEDEGSPSGQAPTSPYSANRALLRDLTLPTAPNLDIPPSPPGSPPPGLNAKFDQFIDLKRKKGTHFNARVAQSAALKNPALMDKLLGFVGMDPGFDDGNDGTEQYATTLPSDLWDPKGFPEWAFRGQLRRSQDRVQKEKARGTGQGVEFVPASSSDSTRQVNSKAGTPKITGKRKSRFDVRD